MYKGYNIVVLGTEHYNTLDLIRSLGEEGITFDYISIKGKSEVASKSKYLTNNIYKANNVEDGYKLLIEKYFDLNNKTIVFCVEDKVSSILDKHYDELKDKFIYFTAYSQGKINYYMNKYNILQIAKKHGLNVLDSRLINKNKIHDDIEYPIITKSESPVLGGWKSDVHICNNKKELEDACKVILSDNIVVQKYIEKDTEYNMDGFSYDHGKAILTIGSAYNYCIKGYYSPYMHITPINDLDETVIKAKNIIKEIGYDGIFDFEFLVKDNKLYFLEINFRINGWAYSSTVAGMNLPKLWLDAMIENKIPDGLPKDFEPFDSMIEPVDYAKRVETGIITREHWLADFKDAKCTYYYNKNDKEPFYEMLRNFDRLK